MNTLLQRISDSEHNQLNTTYWLIKPISDAIRNGNEAQLLQSLQPLIQALKEPNAKFPLEKNEANIVSLVNTFMIAAIQADVYPPFANLVADQAIKRLLKNKETKHLDRLLQEIAKDFCELVIEDRAQRSVSDSNIYVRKTKRFIKTHITQPISLNDIAAHVGISKPYLCKVFKQHTQQTVNDYLLAERIDTAKQMLQTTTYSIGEIAVLLQFCDQSYFTQAFKKITGTTPKAYRMEVAL
ncbi:MAG: helix-turn-helix transcriptional regulator [Lachnospiraceae bacterium]|nr:helix-turn-helix transcriptional regulator [Lachnospiraceae bacterium]